MFNGNFSGIREFQVVFCRVSYIYISVIRAIIKFYYIYNSTNLPPIFPFSRFLPQQCFYTVSISPYIRIKYDHQLRYQFYCTLYFIFCPYIYLYLSMSYPRYLSSPLQPLTISLYACSKSPEYHGSAISPRSPAKYSRRAILSSGSSLMILQRFA